MKALLVPTDLPADITYAIWRETERTRFVATLLGRIVPSARCAGFVAAPSEVGEKHVLLIEPDWPAVAADLRAAGVSAERILVMPSAEDDIWTYWPYAHQVLDRIGPGGSTGMNARDFFEACYPREDDPNWARHYLAAHGSTVSAHRAVIDEVKARLADPESRDVYEMILTAEPPLIWRHYANHAFRALQYFERVTVSPGDVVLDCGIHTGFELPFYLAMLGGEGRVYGFDPIGFDCLSDHVRETVGHFPDVVREVRLAVTDGPGEITLPGLPDGQILGKPEGEAGSDWATFPCQSIDGFVAENGIKRIDLIKLDLEGGEEKALPGAIETIRTLRPQLAVSMYHTIPHFWEIPRFLMHYCEDYRFFIRSYGYESYETLCYAVPVERPLGR